MKAKRLWLVILAVCLVFSGISITALGQGKAPGTAAQPPQREAKKITITGKIDHLDSMGGYFIQGQKPPEVFIILNQNPQVLGKLVKSGQVVKIEAKVEQGDNIYIEQIDGKPYQGKQKPLFK
jgi:hypothetical protein